MAQISSALLPWQELMYFVVKKSPSKALTPISLKAIQVACTPHSGPESGSRYTVALTSLDRTLATDSANDVLSRMSIVARTRDP
ncbi:MAG: hypothetical protein MUC43_09950 [Pirellula sp.]|nr:hypothetical protein [Pirellula sp.]